MAMITVIAIWAPVALLSIPVLLIRHFIRKSADRRERRYYSKRFRMEIG